MQREDLKLQREEMKAARAELSGQKQQMELQNQSLKQQMFEQKFLNLLNVFNQYIADLVETNPNLTWKRSLSAVEISLRRLLDRVFSHFARHCKILAQDQ